MGIPDFPIHAEGHGFEPFFEGLAAGELVISFDPDTGKPLWYPPEVIPGRPGAKVEWRKVSGEGKAYTFTTVIRSLLPGDHKAEVPFTIVLFEPDDWPEVRIPGVLIDADGIEPACAMRLRFKPVAVADRVIAGFAPA